MKENTSFGDREGSDFFPGRLYVRFQMTCGLFSDSIRYSRGSYKQEAFINNCIDASGKFILTSLMRDDVNVLFQSTQPSIKETICFEHELLKEEEQFL